MLRSYNLEQDVIQQIGDPSFHATRYTLVRFIFPPPPEGETMIKDVGVIGLEYHGQIVNMRITSDSGNVEFTMHTGKYDELNPRDIIQRGQCVDEKDATVNELWTQWDVSAESHNNKKIPFLFVSLLDLGLIKGTTRVDLLIAT